MISNKCNEAENHMKKEVVDVWDTSYLIAAF